VSFIYFSAIYYYYYYKNRTQGIAQKIEIKTHNKTQMKIEKTHK